MWGLWGWKNEAIDRPQQAVDVAWLQTLTLSLSGCPVCKPSLAALSSSSSDASLDKGFFYIRV